MCVGERVAGSQGFGVVGAPDAGEFPDQVLIHRDRLFVVAAPLAQVGDVVTCVQGVWVIGAEYPRAIGG